MTNVLVNIGYCQAHVKGANAWDNPDRIGGQQHAEWLEEAIVWWKDNTPYEVAVTATGWPGLIHVPNARDYFERDVLWRCVGRARYFLTEASNPGHQEGAALVIRLGLECAAKLGYEYMIQTAEDVLPGRRSPARLVGALEGGHVYAGNAWGVNRDQLNAQFFACSVADLAPRWDSCRVHEDGCLEAYLRRRLEGRALWVAEHAESWYWSGHDFAEWKRRREEQRRAVG